MVHEFPAALSLTLVLWSFIAVSGQNAIVRDGSTKEEKGENKKMNKCCFSEDGCV